MGKVSFDISMSLDGFITASNRTPDEPMGVGGERLHQWAFGEEERNRVRSHKKGAVWRGRPPQTSFPRSSLLEPNSV
jgi:hypothetical protein